jgi:hypothetical protein
MPGLEVVDVAFCAPGPDPPTNDCRTGRFAVVDGFLAVDDAAELAGALVVTDGALGVEGVLVADFVTLDGRGLADAELAFAGAVFAGG